MSARPTVLWLDDEQDWLTGLDAYLQLQPIQLLKAPTWEQAERALIGVETRVDLLLFDMLLMPSTTTASLRQRKGAEFARKAVRHGVRYFIAYTVLPQEECQEEIRALEDAYLGPSRSTRVRYVGKSSGSVRDVVEAVRQLLDL